MILALVREVTCSISVQTFLFWNYLNLICLIELILPIFKVLMQNKIIFNITLRDSCVRMQPFLIKIILRDLHSHIKIEKRPWVDLNGLLV